MPKKSSTSKTEYVRAYLKKVGDDVFMNTANVDIAKAINDENPNSGVNNHTVANFKSDLRRKDKPATATKKATPKKKTGAKAPASTAKTSTELVPYSQRSPEETVAVAMQFVSSLGSFEKAIHVLEKLRSSVKEI